MRAILLSWFIIACALPGLSLGYSARFSLGWGPIDPADLNLFVGAANGALAFFKTDLGAQGGVPPLELLDDVLGLGLEQGVEFGLVLGVEAAVAKAETSTSGTFALDGVDYPISLSLSLRNMWLGLSTSLSLLNGLLGLGVSGGVAQAEVAYSGQFAYPEDKWTFAYVPPSGEIRAEAFAFYITGFIRMSLGVVPGLGFFLESRGYWQAEVPLRSPEGEVDLNGDGEADRLGFLGFWLAGGIQVAFSF